MNISRVEGRSEIYFCSEIYFYYTGLSILNNYLDVYLDVVFMENLVMNYLILWATGRFTRSSTWSLRLFLGAMAGAGYVVVLIIFPQIGFYGSIPAKFLLSLLIIAIAFSPKSIGVFFKTLAV